MAAHPKHAARPLRSGSLASRQWACRYAAQRARRQTPPAAVLSDEAPRDGIAELSRDGSPEKLRSFSRTSHRASGRDSSVAALADRAVLLEAKAHWKAESTF